MRARHHETRRFGQGSAARAVNRKAVAGFVHQLPCTAPGLFKTKKRHERCLAGVGILPDRLAQGSAVAGHVEDIVVHLEGQADTVAKRRQRPLCIFIGACQQGLYIMDISNPVMPDFVGCYPPPGEHIHDTMCVVYDGPDVEHQGLGMSSGVAHLHAVHEHPAQARRPVRRDLAGIDPAGDGGARGMVIEGGDPGTKSGLQAIRALHSRYPPTARFSR